MDYTFPHGYIEEGEIYCVEAVGVTAAGGPSLYLVAMNAVMNGTAIPWDGQRFRKVAPRNRNITAQTKQHLLGRPVKTIVHRI